MNDLKAALQRLADRADDSALAPPSHIRAAGERRTRRAATATAGAAGLAAVAATAVVAALLGSSGDGAPRPADGTATPTPSPQRSETWETIKPPWGKKVSPNAVAAIGSRFVLVADNSGGEAREPIWWSDDGRAWTQASGAPDSRNVTDVIATDDGFLASAVSRDGGAVYWSSDGKTWEHGTVATSERGDVDALWGITETDLGYFSWGFVDQAPVLYRSSDGRTWTSTDLQAPPGRGADTSLCWVAPSRTGGLTATGQLWDGPAPERLTTWSSQDGSTWVRDEGATGTDGDSIRTCNRLQEPHWSATTDVATVRLEPFGRVGVLYFRPVG